MKKWMIASAVSVCLLLQTAIAIAETRQCEQYSVLVPQGWSFEEARGQVRMISPGGECIATLMTGDSSGKDAFALAGEIAKTLMAPEPEKMENRVAYHFTHKLGRVSVYTRVHEYGGMYLLLSVAGNGGQCGGAADAIWDGMSSADKGTEKMQRLLESRNRPEEKNPTKQAESLSATPPDSNGSATPETGAAGSTR